MTDVTTGQRTRKIRAHKEIINSIDRTMAAGPGTELIATGSDDGTVKVWEGGEEAGKIPVATFALGCPVTAVCWGKDGNSVYVGAIDNEVHVGFDPSFTSKRFVHICFWQVYDLRKGLQVSSLLGHVDTPTSLRLSPNGDYLLSPSLSSQTIIWDIRPFSPAPNRIHRVLQGAPAGFENTLLKGAWSRDDGGRRAALGGADRMVCIWEVDSGKILYKVCVTLTMILFFLIMFLLQLPGHKGTVTSVDFHPKEPISKFLVISWKSFL
jgi:Prp8 binding protein